MEAHLRKITRCLGRAVNELEAVSASEKAVSEVDEEWMTRFHATIQVPIPLNASTDSAAESEPATDSGGDGGDDLRWSILNSTWLPLLRDLHETVGVLDREESALQAAEKGREEDEVKGAADSAEGGGGNENAAGAQGAAASRNREPPRPPKGLMSLRDYTVIHAALEIVVHWGVVPVLEPGVGVFEYDKRPRSRAVKLSRRVLHFWGLGEGRGGRRTSSARHASGVSSTLGDGGGGAQERAQAQAHAQLAVCTGVIQGVVTTDQFMPMLMPLYLPDLLAARLQLVYGWAATALGTTTTAAIAASTTTDSTSLAGPRSHAAAPSGVGSDSAPSDRPATLPTPAVESNRRAPSEGAAASLNEMLVYLGPRQVMAASRQLLSHGTQAPSWFRHRVGRILSEIVLRPGGVQATLEVYIAAGAGAGGGEAGEGDEVKACLRVAKLLATPPKAVGVGTYVARVAPQLAEMLHYDGQQRATITRVVVMIIGRLSESVPRDTKRLILSPLLQPLLLFWGPKGVVRPGPPPHRPPQGGNTESGTRTLPAEAGRDTKGLSGPGTDGTGEAESSVEASEKESALGRCLEDLEKLLTAAPASAALLRLLSVMGVAVPLFKLHCFCKTAKSRNLQSTKASMSALLSSSKTAAAELVAGVLPTKTRWGRQHEPRFCPGPTGGALLRTAHAGQGRGGVSKMRGESDNMTGSNFATEGSKVGSEWRASPPPASDESLLGLEAALEGLGLDPNTLRLMGPAAAAVGDLLGEGGMGPEAALMDALAGLKEAEGRARDAAELLEELGEGSPVAGKVFDLLLRRYLSLRDGAAATNPASLKAPAAPAGLNAADSGKVTAATKIVSEETDQSALSDSAPAAFRSAKEEHAVMAAVVVLAERLGARVFGTGMQMLSCIRLVLEHEQPGEDLVAGDSGEGDGERGRFGGASGHGYVDAFTRVSRVEQHDADGKEEADGGMGAGGGLGLGSEAGAGAGAGTESEEGDLGGGDTLCSVVLALLTTILELGEETRTAEEEEELRAMLGPLKRLAAGHRDAEVAEMSALLFASILSRDLTPEQRRQERERVEAAGDGDPGAGAEAREARTARMLSALDAAEEDLRSESVPLRARGVVTLTRLMRATVESGTGRGRGSGGAGVNMDTAVAQRLLDTYARMAGDSDSYVYLAAVQGLAALADALPGWCIPRLVGLFAATAAAPAPEHPRKKASSSGSCHPRTASPVDASGVKGARAAAAAAAEVVSLTLSQRLKIGEAVLLSARRCGEAMPKYAHFYVNAFVAAARERSFDRRGGGGGTVQGKGGRPAGGRGGLSESPGAGSRPAVGMRRGADAKDETMASTTTKGEGDEQAREGGVAREITLESRERCHFRASCLSNLAEVCQLLRWSLGPFSQDIVDLAVGVLSMETGDSEEATLARRGAAFLLGRLVRGAGGDVLQIVPTADLRAAYRALKRSAERDRDEVTRSHARNGLGYLDAAIRGQLFSAGGSGGGGGGGGVGIRGGEEEEGGAGGQSSGSGHHPGITVL